MPRASEPRTANATDTPRRTRGQRTQRRLLDAGIVVFADRGFHAARVDDVVKEANTSHGTFYLYFANKEDLFGALVAEVAEHMRTLAGELPSFSAPDARAKLRAWLSRFTDLYATYGSVIRAWTEAEMAGNNLGSLGSDTMAEFAGAIAQRMTESRPRPLDPQVAALAVVAMIERLHFYVFSGATGVDRELMLDTLTTMILRGAGQTS